MIPAAFETLDAFPLSPSGKVNRRALGEFSASKPGRRVDRPTAMNHIETQISEKEIVTLLRSGKERHGRQTRPIMPWISYAQLSDEDAQAIARYLKTIAPVRHRVPAAVPAGTPARTPLVHIGLYRSR